MELFDEFIFDLRRHSYIVLTSLGEQLPPLVSAMLKLVSISLL